MQTQKENIINSTKIMNLKLIRYVVMASICTHMEHSSPIQACSILCMTKSYESNEIANKQIKTIKAIVLLFLSMIITQFLHKTLFDYIAI